MREVHDGVPAFKLVDVSFGGCLNGQSKVVYSMSFAFECILGEGNHGCVMCVVHMDNCLHRKKNKGNPPLHTQLRAQRGGLWDGYFTPAA